MNKPEPQKNATEMIKDLIAFLDEEHGESDDIGTMPLSEIDAELAQEGIDTPSFVSAIKHKISRIGAKEKLNEARKKRSALLSLLNTSDTCTLDCSNKADIVQHVKKLLDFSHEEALAYCRKFTKNNEVDIKTLLNDLSLLNKLGSDNEKSKS